jgi:DNA-binding transcriptional LysR family regulator
MRNQLSFDWNDLRYLLAIAREGSTLAAARALHVNQSTVQRRLSELEQRLGCALAERHPAGYRLTDQGRRLLPFAERVEDDVHALQRHAATFDARMIGSVRVTCSTAVAYRLTKSALLDDFHKLYPGITVTLLMTEHTLDLSKGEAEVAIRGGAAREEGLIGKKIADVPWAIYASQSYVERHGQPAIEELDRHGIIEFTGEIAGMAAAKWLPTRAPCAQVVGQASNVPSVLLAVKSGVGLAPLPVPLAVLVSDFVQVFGPLPELRYETFLFVDRDLRHIARIAAFFNHCVANLRPVLTGAYTTRRVEHRAPPSKGD